MRGVAIIQARLNSTRLPNKMLLPITKPVARPIIWYAHWEAQKYFSVTIIACPERDAPRFRTAVPGAEVFGWDGPESDILGRIHACAHHYFDVTPLDVEIARITPDDWPIDVTRDRFTLSQLDRWHQTVIDADLREHIGTLMPGRIEINTLDDYERVKAMVEG